MALLQFDGRYLNRENHRKLKKFFGLTEEKSEQYDEEVVAAQAK